MINPYIVDPQVIVTATQQGTTMVAQLPQQLYDRKLVRAAISGPLTSQFKLYQNVISPSSMLDLTPRGDQNTADYPNPIKVMRGMILIGVWDKVGSASITFYMEPM